jgi:hypothetical protein
MDGGVAWKTAMFRCFQICQQQRTKAGAVSGAIAGGMGRRWRSRTCASRGMETPRELQNTETAGQWKAMWLAVSSFSGHRGQLASSAVTMHLRRRTSRV